MAKHAITGGAGFIGSNLARALLERGDEVIIIDNLITGREENIKGIKNRVRFLNMDINETEKLKMAFRGVDTVFHQAALPSVPRSVEEPMASHTANATGTISVLIAARDAKVRRVVYAASSSAYGDSEKLPKEPGMPVNPLSPYASQKLMGEFYCRQFAELYGMETISLRYFNVFGPRQDPKSTYAAVIPKFIRLMIKGKAPTIYGDGKTSRDFTHIENVVQANILASKAPKVKGETVNVAIGERISLLELVKKINELLGTDIKPRHEAERAGDVKHSLADISKTRELIGYKPTVGFMEGLKMTIEWLRKNPE